MRALFDAKTQDFIGMDITIGANPNSNTMYISTIPIGPLQEKATQQMQSLGLNVYIVDGHVIGTRKRYPGVVFENRTTVGLSTRFDSQYEGFLKIGTQTMYGFKIDWSPLSGENLVNQTGSWISDPITSLIQGAQILSQKRTAIEITEDILQVAALSSSLEEKRNSSDWPEMSFPTLQQIKNQSLTLPKVKRPENPVAPLSWQAPLAAWQNSETSDREEKWKNFVSEVNKNAPLWNNMRAQKYIQNICDEISAPVSIQPRCRIFASMKPYVFSYPGGDIFITAGFVNIVENEAILAFFLSHELAHVYARHFTKNLEQKDFLAKFMNTLSLVTGMLSIRPPQHRLSLENIYIGMMTNYTQDNELEADKLAFEMCLALGFKKNDILNGLQNLQKILIGDFSFGSKTKSGILETRYPSWTERLHQIYNLNDEIRPHQGGVNQAPSSLMEFKKILNGPFEFFRLDSLADNLSSKN